jgi:hypothetical protein
MKISDLGRYRRKKHPQKMLVEFDRQLEKHFENMEDDMFDRGTRNATLKRGEFRPPSGTLFEAIFQELKSKAEREERRHSLSSAISRFRARRVKKQLTTPTQNR